MTGEQKKFYDIKTASDYETIGDDIDYMAYVDYERREVVLLFEESDSKEDWINNFLFIPWPIKLGGEIAWTTLGYARAYKSTKNKPVIKFMDLVLDAPADFHTAVRGWSFGSAMAKIAARHLDNMGYWYEELTTYGDVKCWLNPFYKSKAKVVHNYVASNDLVTICVPFFHRDRKCKVGPRFSLRDIFKSEYYHNHYEDYDYTIWEDL